MTYKEEVYRLIELLDVAYDIAGGLRDKAVGGEKEAFNITRGRVGEAISSLRQMSRIIPADRANVDNGDKVDKYIIKKLDLHA